MNTKNEVVEYIKSQPKSHQDKLNQIRDYLFEILPNLKEKMSYGIPTIYLDKNIFHYAAYKEHIGLYPGPTAIEQYVKELNKYEVSKGTIRIPPDQDIPLGLIKKLVKFNIKKTPKLF
jgi:uncharacterized protein YdhG (YjbR/CyaY superfamily)